MQDEQLYGLLAVAHRLGIHRLDDLLSLSVAEFHLWAAFFARENAERELARKRAR